MSQIDLKMNNCLNFNSNIMNDVGNVWPKRLNGSKMNITDSFIKCTILKRPNFESEEGCVIYCRVPEGRGLQRTARPLSRDETRSVNPLVLNRWTSPNLQREPPTCWVYDIHTG